MDLHRPCKVSPQSVGVPAAILSTPMLAITKIISDRIRPLMAFGHYGRVGQARHDCFRRNPALIEFHRLVEQEIPRLRRYARALTRNADRADDLVQETLTRAIDKAHLWQTGTDIRAWLFTIMHNQDVNMVRRAIRDEAGIDIQQISASLVATTDPTASR
jgi:hypothetical protein